MLGDILLIFLGALIRLEADKFVNRKRMKAQDEKIDRILEHLEPKG